MSEAVYSFQFTVSGLPENTFVVHSFTGNEGISELYHFDVLLVSEKTDINYDKILQKSCQLKVTGRNHSLLFNGIVSSLRFKEFQSGNALYQAVLVPQLYNLTLQKHSQVFLNSSLTEIIKSVLDVGNISNYDLRLKGSYQPMEYVCQFNETYYDFLSRWMEHSGLYYFFEQGKDGEKLIITDTAISHSMFDGSELTYLPISGLDDNIREDVVYNFIAEYSSVPKNVLFKDYSYQHPSLSLQGQADVLESGVGTYYSYGENFQDPQETAKFAQVRAEGFQCRQTQMHGESLCPAMLSGYSFSLQKHFHSDFNGDYLLTKVQHKARNRTAFTTAMGTQRQAEEKKSVYSNSFTTIPLKQQFRPPIDTEKPKFFGMLSAHIDAAGSGKYAQLDKYGRYKVILPFDLSGRKDGKASSWLRLAEPYAGSNYGLHFPLLKGTEVLITFVEGDIDRPVIITAIHNFEQLNHVKDSNQPINSITTAGGNQIVMGDTGGKGFIGFRLPNSQGGWVIAESDEGTGSGSAGSHSSAEGKGGDDGGGESGGKSGGGEGGGDSGESGGDSGESGDDSTFMSYDKEHFESSFSQKTEITGGTSTEIGFGVKNELFVGGKSDLAAGLSWGATLGPSMEYAWGDKVGFGSEEFSCHEERAFLLEEEFEVKVGPRDTLVTTMNSLRTAFKALIASSIATSTENFLSFELAFNNKENLNDGYQNWVSLMTDGFSLADIAFSSAIMIWVHKLLNQVKTISQQSSTAASFTLSKKHGVDVKVDSAIGAEAKVAIGVGESIPTVQPGPVAGAAATNLASTSTLDPLASSLISIDAGGKSVTVTNQDTASLKLNEGTTIDLQVKGAGELVLTATDAKLLFGENSSLVMDEDQLTITSGVETKPTIELNEEQLLLKYLDCSIELGQEGIAMKSPALKAQADSEVKINADGLISLG